MRIRKTPPFLLSICTIFAGLNGLSIHPLYGSTSAWVGPGSDFDSSSNWSAGIPTDIAVFNTANPLSIAFSANTNLNTISFNSGAAGYSLALPSSTELTLSGAGVLNASGTTQHLSNQGSLVLQNSASLGNLVLAYTNGGSANFFDNSTAGNADITMNAGSQINFGDDSSAGNATITDTGGSINFLRSSTAGTSNVTNNAGTSMNFSATSSAANASITNNQGGTNFSGTSTASNATIVNNSGSTNFGDTSTAGSALITNNAGGSTNFFATSNAGNATIANNGGGTTNFTGSTSAGNSSISIDPSSAMVFDLLSTAGNATINNNGSINFASTSTAGNSTIVISASAYVEFDDSSTAGNSLITNNGGSVSFLSTSTGGNATLINNNGDVDFSGLTSKNASLGSMAGSGSFEIDGMALTVGSNNDSTTISGGISGIGGSIIKTGAGTLTLSGSNSFTGSTQITDGTVNLTGSLIGAGIVSPMGALTGNGTLGSLTNQGMVTPGVNGAGILHSSTYSGSGVLNVGINGSSYSGLKVTGMANVNGGTLNVSGTNFLVGHYDVLSAGSLTGTFTHVNTPFSSFLKFLPLYTPTDLLIVISFSQTFTSVALTENQRQVATTLDTPKSNSTSDFTSAITAITLLSAPQARNAYDEISGDALASFQSIGLENATSFVTTLRRRLHPDEPVDTAARTPSFNFACARDTDTLKKGTLSSPQNRFWSNGEGSVNNTNGDTTLGSPSSHATTSGFQAGYDLWRSEEGVVGLSGGYLDTGLDVYDRSSSGHTAAVQSGIYASYSPANYFFNAALAYANNTNQMTREINFPGINEQADSSFQSSVYTTSAEAGYSFKPRATTRLEPSVSLVQKYFKQNAFSETNAPGLNLTIDDQTLDSVVSAANLSIVHLFLQDSAHPCNLSVHAAWQHEWSDTENRIVAQFSDAPDGQFSVEGTPRDRNVTSLGIQGQVTLVGGLQGFGSYSAALSENQSSQALLGGIILTW